MNSEMEALSKCVAELGELEAEQHQIEEVLQVELSTIPSVFAFLSNSDLILSGCFA